MSPSAFTRRAALAVTFALMASTATISEIAPARSSAIGGVHVDVGALRQNSGEPTAGWVAEELPGAIAAALSASGQAGEPVSARIDYILLGPNTGAGPAGSSPDQIVGEVSVGGVTRPLRATSNYYEFPTDKTMVERSNHLRVSQLVQAFAGWVAKGY